MVARLSTEAAVDEAGCSPCSALSPSAKHLSALRAAMYRAGFTALGRNDCMPQKRAKDAQKDSKKDRKRGENDSKDK